MMYRIFCFLSTAYFLFFFSAAKAEGHDSLILKKTVQVAGPGAYAGGMTGLYFLWYNNYPTSNFHWFNDNHEWLQIDKVGHVYSAYQLSSLGMEIMQAVGFEENKAFWYGGLYGYLFQTTIEVFDGFSAQWGASWGDVAANTLGTGLAMTQEKLWNTQKIKLKYGYAPTQYASIRPNILGQSHLERILKDYNGQSYWITSAPSAWFTQSNWPQWLEIAVGYSGTGMVGGEDNIWVDNNGNQIRYDHIKRVRYMQLSFDIDWQKLPAQSRFTQSLYRCLNGIKMPLPSLHVSQYGDIKMGWSWGIF